VTESASNECDSPDRRRASVSDDLPCGLSPPFRVVLVGFMGAGKSSVGRLVAQELGWSFVDLDEEVARLGGEPVAEIIRSRGVRRFRQLESKAGRDALRRDRVVIATGGGWAAQPENAVGLNLDVRSVWLRVTPASAVARVAASSVCRPLLEDAPDPLRAAKVLLRERTSHYAKSHITIDTEERTPDEVACKVVEALRNSRSESGSGSGPDGPRAARRTERSDHSSSYRSQEKIHHPRSRELSL